MLLAEWFSLVQHCPAVRSMARWWLRCQWQRRMSLQRRRWIGTGQQDRENSIIVWISMSINQTNNEWRHRWRNMSCWLAGWTLRIPPPPPQQTLFQFPKKNFNMLWIAADVVSPKSNGAQYCKLGTVKLTDWRLSMLVWLTAWIAAKHTAQTPFNRFDQWFQPVSFTVQSCRAGLHTEKMWLSFHNSEFDDSQCRLLTCRYGH